MTTPNLRPIDDLPPLKAGGHGEQGFKEGAHCAMERVTYRRGGTSGTSGTSAPGVSQVLNSLFIRWNDRLGRGKAGEQLHTSGSNISRIITQLRPRVAALLLTKEPA